MGGFSGQPEARPMGSPLAGGKSPLARRSRSAARGKASNRSFCRPRCSRSARARSRDKQERIENCWRTVQVVCPGRKQPSRISPWQPKRPLTLIFPGIECRLIGTLSGAFIRYRCDRSGEKQRKAGPAGDLLHCIKDDPAASRTIFRREIDARDNQGTFHENSNPRIDVE